MNRRFFWLSAAYLLSSTALSSFLLIQQHITINILSSPSLVGILLAVNFLPKVVFIPIGGVIADKYGKRLLLVSTTIARVFLLSGACYFSFNNNLTINVLYLISFIFGMLDAIFIPTANSCLPYLVNKNKLHKANSTFSACNQIGVIIGPLLVSFIIDNISLNYALIITITLLVTCSLASIGVSITIPTSKGKTIENNTISSSIRVIKELKLGQDLGLLAIASFFFTGVLVVLTPLLSSVNFGDSAKYIGALNATYGIGVIIFSIFSQIKKGNSKLTLVTAVYSLSGLIILLSTTKNYIIVSGIYFCFGFIVSWINVTVMTNLQRRSPKDLIGKTIALAVFASQVCLPISFGLISVLTNLDVSAHRITLFYGIGLLSFSLAIAYIRHSFTIKALNE